MSSVVIRAVASAFTLYLILILVRWLSPWLELDLRLGKLKWVPTLTDPLIDRVRRLLPFMGPADFAPVVTVLVVWLAREIAVLVLVGTLH